MPGITCLTWDTVKYLRPLFPYTPTPHFRAICHVMMTDGYPLIVAARECLCDQKSIAHGQTKSGLDFFLILKTKRKTADPHPHPPPPAPKHKHKCSHVLLASGCRHVMTSDGDTLTLAHLALLRRNGCAIRTQYYPHG